MMFLKSVVYVLWLASSNKKYSSLHKWHLCSQSTYLNHLLQKLLSVNLLDPDYYRDQDQTNWKYCNIIKIKTRLGK